MTSYCCVLLRSTIAASHNGSPAGLMVGRPRGTPSTPNCLCHCVLLGLQALQITCLGHVDRMEYTPAILQHGPAKTTG
jgi:hypothetical protein